MLDAQHLRVSRELSLAAVGVNLAHVEPWVTDRLVAILEEDDVRAGDAIYRLGEPPDFFCFAREGSVRLEGKGRSARVLEGPAIFGLVEAMLDRPRNVGATAVTPLQFLRIRTDAWNDLLEDSFTLARAAVTGLARAVAVLEEKTWAADPCSRPVERRPIAVGPGPLTLIDRLAVLMEAPLLRGAGVQTLSDLAATSEEVAFGPGESVYRTGAPRERLVIVLAGEVTASREDPHVVWRGGPGQIVCDTASVGDPAMAWQAQAATPVRALAVGVEDWFDVMEEQFEMVRATLAALALQHEELLEREIKARREESP